MGWFCCQIWCFTAAWERGVQPLCVCVFVQKRLRWRLGLVELLGWIDSSVRLHWWDAADLRVPVPALLRCSHCWRHSGFSGFKGDGPLGRGGREAALSRGPWVVYLKPFNPQHHLRPLSHWYLPSAVLRKIKMVCMLTLRLLCRRSSLWEAARWGERLGFDPRVHMELAAVGASCVVIKFKAEIWTSAFGTSGMTLNQLLSVINKVLLVHTMFCQNWITASQASSIKWEKEK